ncbi:MAG TPA: phosphatidylserine decarboxylase [Phycisphaerales bacterium]|nr:phosphatidylserine decarboxylase [Phycisphaerales bacterium]
MPLTPYGLKEWSLMTLGAVVLAVPCVYLHWWWPLGLIIVVWMALVSFFRDPIRSIPKNLKPGDMLSPADGVISAVERVDTHECVEAGKPAVIIRIFLSVLNVHVNRAPFDGEVTALRYCPGKFLNAQTAESARVNECNFITVRISSGETIGIRQVSGMIARRIVCPLKVGDRLIRGKKFGMIKFGSTTELILPHPNDVEVFVKIGDKVRGGKTILASLALTPASPQRILETRTHATSVDR